MHEKPLQKCLKNNDFEMARFLLNSGADPRCISFVEGDTPLHAAVSICFDKNGKHVSWVAFLVWTFGGQT